MYRIMVVRFPNLFLCEVILHMKKCDELHSQHLYGVGYRWK